MCAPQAGKYCIIPIDASYTKYHNLQRTQWVGGEKRHSRQNRYRTGGVFAVGVHPFIDISVDTTRGITQIRTLRSVLDSARYTDEYSDKLAVLPPPTFCRSNRYTRGPTRSRLIVPIRSHHIYAIDVARIAVLRENATDRHSIDRSGAVWRYTPGVYGLSLPF